LNASFIIPNALDPRVPQAVAKAVSAMAIQEKKGKSSVS
jgi:malate dehydrogenase (oxaloacetate-decarboxylating)